VARAIVFLVAPCPLVLLHQIGIVLIDRVARRQASLRMGPHPQAVEIRGRHVLLDHVRPHACKPLGGRPVDVVRVRVRIWREIDLGPGHVQETEVVA